jgi:hypothetical protein
MVDQIKYDLIATDKASANIAKVRKETERLGKQANVTAGSARQLSGSTTGLGRSAGMAGIQFQQLVGQVQGGVNPMVALSQQAADLGFVLGAPLAGVIVSLGASIATFLIPSLNDAVESFDELQKRIKGISNDYRDLSEVTKQQLLRAQTEEVEKATEAFKENKAELDSQITILDILRARQLRVKGSVDETTGSIVDAKTRIREHTEAVAESELALIAEERKLVDLQNTLGITNGVRETTARIISRGNVASGRNLEALEKEAAIIREQIKPAMQVFNDAKNRLLLLEKEELLTKPEVEARIEQLTEAYEKSTASVDRAKKSVDFYNISMKEVRRDGLKSLEDGLVGLITKTTSVSEAFRNMATSIINDLARMAIRQAITIPLAQSMGLSVGERALGGSMTANKPYLVGERGPELVIPRGGSDVVPNNRLTGGSPVNITLNVSTGVSATVRQEMQEMLPRIAEVAKSAVQNAQMRRRM